MPLTAAEQRVCEAIAAGRDELVGLASALIGFDTTARQVGDPCRDEAALQEYLAGRLECRRGVGGRVGAGRRLRWPGCRSFRPGFPSRGGRS